MSIHSSTTQKPLDLFPQNVQQYCLKEYLGQGTYSDVCLYIKNDEKVAIKLENINQSLQFLASEALILRKLTQHKVEAVPKYIDHGLQFYNEKNLTYNYLIMEYVDQSVQEYLAEESPEKLSFGQICQQMLYSLKCVHQQGFIHKDIKPDNFRIKDHRVYLIDFGLAREYISNGEYLFQWQVGKLSRNTPMFSSLNIHWKYEASRRDDLISLGYTILHLSSSSLPWVALIKESQSVTLSSSFKQISDQIIQAKQSLFENDYEEVRNKRIVQLIAYLNQSLRNEADFYIDPDYDFIGQKLKEFDHDVEMIEDLDQLKEQDLIDSSSSLTHQDQFQPTFEDHCFPTKEVPQQTTFSQTQLTFNNICSLEIIQQSSTAELEILDQKCQKQELPQLQKKDQSSLLFQVIEGSFKFLYKNSNIINFDFTNFNEEEQMQLISTYYQVKFKSFHNKIEQASFLIDQLDAKAEYSRIQVFRDLKTQVENRNLKINTFTEENLITTAYLFQDYAQFCKCIKKIKKFISMFEPSKTQINQIVAQFYFQLDEIMKAVDFANEALVSIMDIGKNLLLQNLKQQVKQDLKQKEIGEQQSPFQDQKQSKLLFDLSNINSFYHSKESPDGKISAQKKHNYDVLNQEISEDQSQDSLESEKDDNGKKGGEYEQATSFEFDESFIYNKTYYTATREYFITADRILKVSVVLSDFESQCEKETQMTKKNASIWFLQLYDQHLRYFYYKIYLKEATKPFYFTDNLYTYYENISGCLLKM